MPPRNKLVHDSRTRSFETEQKAGSRYTVEWPKNVEETHADMLDGWRPVPCTYVLNGVDLSSLQIAISNLYSTASYFQITIVSA